MQFDKCNAFQSVGVLAAKYEAAAETSTKRLPLFLQIGGLCSGIALKNDELKTRFVDKLVLIANNLGIDVSLPPADKQPDPIPRVDPTLRGATPAQLEDVNFVGQMIFNRLCRQLDFIAVDGPFKFTVENGLILTARVVGRVDAQGRVQNECAALVLSNMYGAPLNISIGAVDATFCPPLLNRLHTTSGVNNASSTKQMRREVIKYLGLNNVLVGFHLGWALAAIQLPVSAGRVIDLSMEPVFSTFTYNLARSAKLPSCNRIASIISKQKAPLDRRSPAVLFEDWIEFRQNQCDNVYAESIFTAAVWRAVSSSVARTRQAIEVWRVKAAYSIGMGLALNSVETVLASTVQNLLKRVNAYGDEFVITAPPATRDQFFRSVETAHCDVSNHCVCGHRAKCRHRSRRRLRTTRQTPRRCHWCS